jgi:hypothetical protein
MLKAVALGLGMFVLLMLGLVVFQSALGPDLESAAPTDETLDANFRAHRTAFESLLEMSRADRSVIRIANDFTWLDTDSSWPRPEDKLGFPKQRLDQYRHLFREASLQGGILQEKEGGVTYFIYWSRGLMTNGSF